MDIGFFGHQGMPIAHIWANWAEIFMGTQETIIYRLVKRNQLFDTILPILILWVNFVRKMGVATTRAPMGLGPRFSKPKQNVSQHSGPFRSTI